MPNFEKINLEDFDLDAKFSEDDMDLTVQGGIGGLGSFAAGAAVGLLTTAFSPATAWSATVAVGGGCVVAGNTSHDCGSNLGADDPYHGRP